MTRDRAVEWLNENSGESLSDAEYEARLVEAMRELEAIDAAQDEEEV